MKYEINSEVVLRYEIKVYRMFLTCQTVKRRVSV